MKVSETLAVIGSGPSAIYLLKHVLEHAEVLRERLREILVFEKCEFTGMGMPYSPNMTDRFNLANISSEELPELPRTLASWLRAQSATALKALGIGEEEISDGGIYSRLALGEYFKSQYKLLCAWLEEAGIRVSEHAQCEVTDIQDEDGLVRLFTAGGEIFEAGRVVIATGHHWPNQDSPQAGCFASPWPIAKLLPEEGEYFPFTIGTLGASLSAFDVISSLAHRHGRFEKEGNRLAYHADDGAGEFKMVMHAAQGLLPHLQFEQKKPKREIYRHVSREEMLALRDEDGFLRLGAYFDQVCRPVLMQALEKNGLKDVAVKLRDPGFGFADFAEAMTEKHDYANAFEGMRKEMVEAEASAEAHRPIYWKEALDDLMYTLNYHADQMPAEDHLLLRAKVMPFVMNVVAAMPLESGKKILALYDAGRLELVAGDVKAVNQKDGKGVTVEVAEGKEEEGDGGETTPFHYRMFIDCKGQSPVGVEEYPFPSLVKAHKVRAARVPYVENGGKPEDAPNNLSDRMDAQGRQLHEIGGIDIDETYHVIGGDGLPNPRVLDMASPHIAGLRPYSYGLPACCNAAEIVVEGWLGVKAR